MRGLGARVYEWIARGAAIYLRRGRREIGVYVDRGVA
jgi:hypothetical protein